MIVLTYKPKKFKIVVEEFVNHLAKNQKMLLMPVGDIHEGSDGWPKEKFLYQLKFGMDRGATFLGMGDPLDFTSDSQRAIIAPLRDSTKKQLDDFMTERTERFAEMMNFTKGRWIGMLEGNHRWQFQDGTTTDQLLCRKLGCEFLGTSALIRISQGVSGHDEADCKIYAHHGVGGGRTAGGHLTRLEDLLKSFDADIYLMGHVHTKVNDPIDRQYVSKEGIHYHRTMLMARTGGWLRGYVSSPPKGLDVPAIESRGSYVEAKAMMPTSLGGLCIGIGYDEVEEARIKYGIKLYRPTIHCSS